MPGGRPSTPIITRFEGYVLFDDGCWLWAGARDKDGYGRFRVTTKTVPAHRVSLALYQGLYEPELAADHLCRNKACVNPDHLEFVSWEENTKRYFRRAFKPAIHCRRGHEYTGETTAWQRDGERLSRYCKICRRMTKTERETCMLPSKGDE